ETEVALQGGRQRQRLRTLDVDVPDQAGTALHAEQDTVRRRGIGRLSLFATLVPALHVAVFAAGQPRGDLERLGDSVGRGIAVDNLPAVAIGRVQANGDHLWPGDAMKLLGQTLEDGAGVVQA